MNEEDPNKDWPGGSGSPGPQDLAPNQEQAEGLVPAEVADSYFDLLEDYALRESAPDRILRQDLTNLRIRDHQPSVPRPESPRALPQTSQDRMPALESSPEKESLGTGDAMPRETPPEPELPRRIRGQAEREGARAETGSGARGSFTRRSPLSQFLCELCGFECRWLGEYQRHLVSHLPPQQ